MHIPRLPLAMLLSTTALLTTLPFTDSPASAASPSAAYPLRHSFSLVPGIPGHGKTEPTSCYDTADGKGYVCRIVAGYEETGYHRDFVIGSSDALDTGHEPAFGTVLVSRGGYVYEGCNRTASGDWVCDYKTRRQVSRDHYESRGHVARVFWKWKDYIKSQAGCAGAIVGLWTRFPGKGLLFFLDECNNGPL